MIFISFHTLMHTPSVFAHVGETVYRFEPAQMVFMTCIEGQGHGFPDDMVLSALPLSLSETAR